MQLQALQKRREKSGHSINSPQQCAMMMDQGNQKNPGWDLASAFLHVPHVVNDCVCLPHIPFSFLWHQAQMPCGELLYLYYQPCGVGRLPCSLTLGVGSWS